MTKNKPNLHKNKENNPKEIVKNDKEKETSIEINLDFILKKIIRFSVSILAILMTIMIFFGVIDVAKTIYSSFSASEASFPGINELLLSFGAFMAVLIAIEILINITIYLQDNSIHTKIVMATALIAVARKVIVMDIEKIAPEYVWAIAGIILATSIGYWLAMISPEENEKRTRFHFNRFKNKHNNQKTNETVKPEN